MALFQKGTLTQTNGLYPSLPHEEKRSIVHNGILGWVIPYSPDEWTANGLWPRSFAKNGYAPNR